MADEKNWPEVVCNLRKARRKWERLTRVLSREGVDDRTSDQIYLAVVQEVLLYASDTWAIIPRSGRVLGGFHHRVTRRLTGRKPQRGRDRVWIYSLLEDAMKEAGLKEVEIYLSLFQNTTAQFIATRPIMDLCMAAEWIMGPRISN